MAATNNKGDNMSQTGAAPLSNLTVLDFGQVFQGPYASFLLAQAGANVIKIEPPNGEPLRHRAQPGIPITLPFAMLNANKRGITLNLKSAEGRELLFEMVRRADVLLENFAPGTMDGLGVGWDVVREINPRLVYATGTGFGISGPDSDTLAMDLTVQAASGIMSMTGFPDRPPVRVGGTVADFMGGIHLYAAIVTAIYDRERTGKGQRVEIAMQEAIYFTLSGGFDHYNRTGKAPQRAGNGQSANSVSPYNVYQASDGYVAIHTVSEQHWLNILAAAGREDVKDDPRFKTNYDRCQNKAEVDAIVGAWLATITKAEAVAASKKHRFPLAPVREIPEVMADAHMHARGALNWVEHPQLGRVVLPSSPLRMHGATPVERTPSPRLGEHTEEILAWLGKDAATVEQLRRDKVV
jgi:CoA:oxalate CoA-transferase